MVRSTSSSPDRRDRAPSDVPTIDIDPYSTEVLTDPYPFHRELREAGPVVWLEPHRVWATGRYEQVRTVLTDWETFMSGAGTGLVDVRVDHWREPSLLLESDPPEHTVVREIMERILLPPDAFERHPGGASPHGGYVAHLERGIAWNSVEGEVDTSGQVRFEEVAAGRTRVEVTMNYADPPSGRIGELATDAISNPERELREDLENFAERVERGELRL